MTSEITGFDYRRIAVGDGGELNVAVGGAGRPIVLLHGFPQTHLMWRHVAADLAADHTVICPDLRGYGDSDKPAETGDSVYSKRTMAADVVAVARALGHERFAVAGHDRGAFVAIRAGLDHPEAVTHLASLDVLPLLDTWDVLHGVPAAVGFHLFLMAQPPGLPEAMIAATADDFFGYFLDAWTRDPAAIAPAIREVYLRSCAAAVPSIVADYRASAGIDLEHDRADRAAGNLLRMPVAVLQQDWGAALGFDAEALWRAWAPDLRHTTVSCGHFMAEESPATVTSALRALLTR
ncbi:alpha/beta fold hydrolase [Nocardia brasiliensis]|uniref:alpha/beta fold hydrolase n=1 Tax=Nocardia brasiliensis TaxID=37326 RepID=UPI001893BA5B|nr:alpha/beta hydrolase [Nocardia brasiliensis]MBF6545317.1 alpha/beta hydrolase [Nocardia brasiliensis]